MRTYWPNPNAESSSSESTATTVTPTMGSLPFSADQIQQPRQQSRRSGPEARQQPRHRAHPGEGDRAGDTYRGPQGEERDGARARLHQIDDGGDDTATPVLT